MGKWGTVSTNSSVEVCVHIVFYLVRVGFWKNGPFIVCGEGECRSHAFAVWSLVLGIICHLVLVFASGFYLVVPGLSAM